MGRALWLFGMVAAGGLALGCGGSLVMDVGDDDTGIGDDDTVDDGMREDVFEQRVAAATDVLFVVDNSCSMAEEQQALQSNFYNFIQTGAMRIRREATTRSTPPSETTTRSTFRCPAHYWPSWTWTEKALDPSSRSTRIIHTNWISRSTSTRSPTAWSSCPPPYPRPTPSCG